MAQEKEERPGVAAKKTGDTGEDSTRRSTATPGRSGTREGTREVANGDGALAPAPPGRRERYVIGVRTAPGGQPLAEPQQAMAAALDYLGRQENVEILRRIKLGGAQPFVAGGRGTNELVVAKIDEGKAQRLRAAAPAYLLIERDTRLSCADYLPTAARLPIGTLLPMRATATEVTIRVIGERDQPLAGATVVLEDAGWPVRALTDDSGTARLSLFGGSIEAIQTLFVRAAANHWDRLIHAPRLGCGPNTVKLRPLAELFPGFPAERLLGWGQRLMRLDAGGGRFTGSGVRIGLIDSGCDNTHPLLRHVTRGKDFTAAGADSWTQDLLAHGTHCAGIVNAAGSGAGIAGCAPEAELHVFKVMPEGRISDLLAALDECMERELDLINLSVVTEGFSELVSQKLQEVTRRGIACIAAAGNSGGPVAFPALLPGLLTVAAVGKLKEFPADSSHVLSVIPQLIGRDEVFAASFSAAGPQVAVSAPGVAVVSSVPGGGYAAADGTSAAAAHVTGLAALVLAHHPLFQDTSLRAHSPQRVQALFELIRASALPHFPDLLRGGVGVPQLQRIPAAQSLALTRAAAEAERVYWPLAGWPAWPPVQPSASGLF